MTEELASDRTCCDWVHLPEGVETLSLWSVMHDGRIESIVSDRAARTVVVLVQLAPLHAAGERALGGRLALELAGASSLRAVSWQMWPGPRPQIRGLTRAEQTALVAEYQGRAREVSLDWGAFEELVSTSGYRVSDADLARADGEVALRVTGHLASGEFTTLSLRGSGCSFRSQEGTDLVISEMIQVAQDTWDAAS